MRKTNRGYGLPNWYSKRMSKQPLTNLISDKTDVQELLFRLAQLGTLNSEGRTQEGVVEGDGKPSLQLQPVTPEKLLFCKSDSQDKHPALEMYYTLSKSRVDGIISLPPLSQDEIVVVCGYAEDKLLVAYPILAKSSAANRGLPLSLDGFEDVTRCEVSLLLSPQSSEVPDAG